MVGRVSKTIITLAFKVRSPSATARSYDDAKHWSEIRIEPARSFQKIGIDLLACLNDFDHGIFVSAGMVESCV